MGQLYGHRWLSSYGEADDGTWLAGLQGVTPEQLAIGVQHCVQRGESWPPSMPEFRSRCRPLPQDLGIVNEIEAYREAVKGAGAITQHPWSHPVVYHAAKHVGFWSLLHWPESKTFPRFRDAYFAAVEQFMQGEAMPLPARTSVKQITRQPDPEKAKAALAKIKAMLGKGGSDEPIF